ncbi:type II toxin-antitoxin system VapC family toxin [bacterium]|nr:MAG: type II toxin-antitoxin system VapC family toxin [bacterium]
MDSVPLKWRDLRGGRIYVDTNAWIYARDMEAKWEELRCFFDFAHAGAWKLVTSELTLAETLVWPIQNRDRRAQSEFQEALQNASHLVVIPVSRPILIEAATLKATRALELPDAIHAATAKLSRCSYFLTGDEELARAVHLPHLRTSDIAIP